MEAVLLALIAQLNGAVFILVCIFLIIAYGLYRAGGIVTMFNAFRTKSEKIDDKLDTMTSSLADIRATTNLLYQAHVTTVKAASPIKLTSIGLEISKALNIPMMVDGHWDVIKSEIEKRNPQNPYDIQSVAMSIARRCFEHIFSEAEQNAIKTYAFGRGMNLLEIFPIIAIEIRDRVLKERGIPLEDVDKHDPAKQARHGA